MVSNRCSRMMWAGCELVHRSDGPRRVQTQMVRSWGRLRLGSPLYGVREAAQGNTGSPSQIDDTCFAALLMRSTSTVHCFQRRFFFCSTYVRGCV